jgi:hypothetical protein
MKDYSRDELITHSCVAEDLLALWEEAGVFKVAVEGRYTLHHLVQAVVCDRLYRLGLPAATLRVACQSIDYSWQSGAHVAFSIGQTHLWISFSHSQIQHHGARREAVGLLLRSGPRVQVVNDVELMAEIRNEGRFGIVINLLPIVHEIEERSGDKLIS